MTSEFRSHFRKICTRNSVLGHHLSHLIFLSRQVVVNDVKPEIAIAAYGLQDELPYTTLYYKVRVAREKGTYNKEIIKLQTKQQKRLGLVIDVTADAGEDCRGQPFLQSQWRVVLHHRLLNEYYHHQHCWCISTDNVVIDKKEAPKKVGQASCSR